MEVGLVVIWVATFLLLGLAALPIATWLLPESADAGLAIPLALAVLGIVGYLVGQFAFGLPAVLAGLAVLAVGSALSVRVVELDLRAYAEVAGVFVLAFGLVIWIRSLTPAAAPLPLAIGEKFLDFGLLRTLERSGQLPPEDMWFAGEPMRYYYGGHMLTVLLGTLTDTAARYAYNLALAGFFGTLVAAAYGLAGSLVEGTRAPRRLAAGLGAFFVGIAGNLETLVRVLVWGLPGPVDGWLVGLTGTERGITEWSPGDFYYFDASRVLPTDPSVPDSAQAATEFPLFAWLNGDLHAHMMAQPFLLLVVGLALAYYRLPAESRRKRLAVLAALTPVAGVVGLTSIWSFPTVGGLLTLAVALAPADPATLLPAGYRDRVGPQADWFREEVRRVGFGLASAVAVLAAGVIWTLPFWLGAVLEGPGRTVTRWYAHSPLGPLLVIHGAFLAVFAVALARRCGGQLSRPSFLYYTGAVVLLVAFVLGFPALGLVGPLVVGGWWLLRTQEDTGFPLLLVVAGAGILLLVELITVEGERFNTIFKPYAQVWLFWALGAGALGARLATGWPAELLAANRERLALGGRALVAVLVVTTSLYAVFALPAHQSNPGPAVQAEGRTLDATAYLEYQYPREAEAIRWLDQQAGQPTIVTAAPGGYVWDADRGRGSSAPASLTGVSTVLGWHHESQYRGDDPYRLRLEKVKDIYTHENQGYQRDLLTHYDVEYIYVGPAERARYGELTVENVPGVTVEKKFENVTIYRVEESG